MKLRFPLLTTGALLLLTGSAVSQDTPDPKPSVELPKITYPDPVTEAQKEAVAKVRRTSPENRTNSLPMFRT